MKRLTLLSAVLAMLMTVAAPAGAARNSFPDVIPLPDGFAPEGIAIGRGTDVYAGSLAGGSIWKGSLRSGEGEILVERTDSVAVGMSFDRRSGSLFVAGGPTGTATVYDGRTGDTVAQFSLGEGFINDVIVTRKAAYFTNSFAPELYEVPLGARGAISGPVRTIPLGGDFVFIEDDFNANGIEATPNGKTLIVANSAAGEIYTVDPKTGIASVIDLGESVGGDGLVLAGKTLYANENFLNRIAKIRLSPDLSSGTVIDRLTSPDFDVPTTSARFGRSLYAVNAKFGTDAPPPVTYEIVRVDR